MLVRDQRCIIGKVSKYQPIATLDPPYFDKIIFKVKPLCVVTGATSSVRMQRFIDKVSSRRISSNEDY